MVAVGVLGASGYAGAELLRLAAGHPEFDVVLATGDSQAGTAVADLYPHLAAAYPDLTFTAWEAGTADGLDLVLLTLPHGVSQSVVPGLVDTGVQIVDLGADFRLDDPATYEHWYGEPHAAPDLLKRFAYGIPELFRDDVVSADAVAAAGCHATAATLAIAPLVRAGMVEPTGVVVDTATGASGAGRPPKDATTFCAVDEDVSAYGLLDHRHTPEIEMAARASVLLTPHLVPMSRGILATCYLRAAVADPDPLATLADAYAGCPFVVVADRSPSTKATLGSNAAHVTARYDARTGWIVAIAAIDNLVKGASGQMIQCANLRLGLEETAGLTPVGLYP